MGSDNGTKKGKLTKLSRLEDEVAKLSEQLQENKLTISLLKKSLAERDLRIQELESKLTYAQHSLLKKTTFTIHQCREQIKNGLGEKIVNPALTQIQQQIVAIQGIVHEAKDFLSKKKMLVHENINATSNLAYQCPDLAMRYFEKTLVEPARLLVKDVAGQIDSNVKTGQDLVEQKIIYPGKVWYDKIVVTVQTLPTQGHIIYQVWLEEPVMQKIEALPLLKKELCANAGELAQGLVNQLKSGAEQGLATTVETIKKSQFWDGKHKVEAV